MSIERLESIADRIQNRASVESVYGEPVETAGKTVLPVAKIAYGFGGGYGSAGSDEDRETNGEPQPGEGSGMGGGVSAKPVGIVEITADDTRFVTIDGRKKSIAIAALSFLVGYVAGRSR